MTALTNENVAVLSGAPDEILPHLRSFDVAAATKILAGGIVGIDSSGNAGPVDGTFTVVVGVCERTQDNTLGAAGDLRVLVRRGTFGKFAQTGTTIDKSKVGQKVYAVDDATLSLASGGNHFAGYVDGVQDGVVMYNIGVLPLGA